MPTPVVRIEARPRLISSGAEVVFRMAGGGDRAPYYYGGVAYQAGILQIPRFAAEIGFNDNGWSGGIMPSTGVIGWAPSLAATYANAASLYLWSDAPILVELGFEGDDGLAPAAWTQILKGSIASMEAAEGQIRFTVADLSDALEKPILSGRFAGTGGIEGPAGIANRPKRRSWGYCYNVEGQILDKANSIYEFGDPAFPLQAFDALRDIGRAAAPAPTVLAWQGSIAATFAALQVAVCAQGSGVVAPSIACAKWWTTPVGPLTADIRGEIGAGFLAKPAEVARRVLEAFGGLSFHEATFTAAVAARPELAGLHVADDRLSWASSVDRVLMGSSLIWIVASDGLIYIRPIEFGASAASITADEIRRAQVLPPIKSRRLGYQRNERIHGEGEIAASLLAADISGTIDFGTQVGGPDRPEDNATRNDDGANMIPSPVAFDRAAFDNGAVINDFGGAGGRQLQYGKRIFLAPNFAVVWWEAGSTSIPASPLELLYYSFAAAYSGGTPTTDYLTNQLQCYDSSGALLGVATGGFNFTGSALMAAGGLTVVNGVFTTLAGTAFVRPYTQRIGVAQAGFFYVSEPYLGRQQRGADVSTEKLGYNYVVNSSFSLKEYGFYRYPNSVGDAVAKGTVGGINLAGYSGIRDVYWATVQTSGAAWVSNGSNYTEALVTRGAWSGELPLQKTFSMPVKVDETIYGRALIARHRCTVQVYLLVFDKDGALLSAPSAFGGRVDGGANGDPAQFDEVIVPATKITAPTAAYASLMVRMIPNGGADPYVFILEPAMGKLPDGRTITPPYQPGPNDPLADLTLSIPGPPQSTVFKYDAAGAAESGEFNRDFTFKLMSQSGEITSGIVWTYRVATGGFNGATAGATGTLSGSGPLTLTVSNILGEANTIEITGTYQNKSAKISLPLTKQIARPASGVLISKSSSFATLSSSAYSDLTGTMLGTMFTGKTSAVIYVALNAMPASGTTGNWTVRMQVQRLISGTWTDVGASVTAGSDWSAIDVSGSAASISMNISDTSPAMVGGTQYSWRVLGRIDSGTRSHSVTGTVTVSA